MQKAVRSVVGAMAALIGSSSTRTVPLPPKPRRAKSARRRMTTALAKVVVSGNKAAVERAVEIAKTKGAKRAMLLLCQHPSIAP